MKLMRIRASRWRKSDRGPIGVSLSEWYFGTGERIGHELEDPSLAPFPAPTALLDTGAVTPSSAS